MIKSRKFSRKNRCSLESNPRKRFGKMKVEMGSLDGGRRRFLETFGGTVLGKGVVEWMEMKSKVLWGKGSKDVFPSIQTRLSRWWKSKGALAPVEGAHLISSLRNVEIIRPG